MSETSQTIDEQDSANNLILNNILRGLTMLDNSLDRLMRNNFYDRAQYPEHYFDVKSLLINIREWISDYKMFSARKTSLIHYVSMLLTELSQVIIDLFDVISSENGKKQVSKKQKEKQKESIHLSMNKILDKISLAINSLNTFDTDMSAQMEKFVKRTFEKYMNKAHDIKDRLLSSRGEKTIVFPFSNPDNYADMISDSKRFKSEILEKLSPHQSGHKNNCSNRNSYIIIPFRFFLE
jgi:hypothetical protein